MADSKKYDGSQWVHSLRKLTTATETIQSGDTIYANGQPISTYSIKGNTVQNGTPTPSNPVDVNGVGEKTANLFNSATATEGYFVRAGNTSASKPLGNIEANVNYNLSDYIPVEPNTTYTIRYPAYDNVTGAGMVFYSDNLGTTISGVPLQDQSKTWTFTTPLDCTYIRFSYKRSSNVDYNAVMLNADSTALPYEPYGYKIPISSAGQTIDIYIGDLPLLKSLDGTAVDEINNGTLTRRVDSDGSVLPTPTTTQITMPSIPTIDGANTITVDTTVQPSEFTATWTGWHDSSVKEYDGNDWQ